MKKPFFRIDYDKVFIDRIQVFPKKENEDKGVDHTDLKMLVDYFYEALVKEIKPTVQIVDKTGPNVLVLRIAIVDLVPTNYALSIAGTLTPYAFIAEASSGPASGRPAGSTPYLGESSVEIQFVDGESRQILGEFTDTKIGKKYDVDTSKGAADATKAWVNGLRTPSPPGIMPRRTSTSGLCFSENVFTNCAASRPERNERLGTE